MARTPSPAMLAAITAFVVVAGAGAGILLQPTTDRPAPVKRGSDVNIAVVDPREPVPEPGSVMDVGDLADGYTHGGYTPSANRSVVIDASRGYPPPRVQPSRVEQPREIVAEPVRPPVVIERREPPPRWSSRPDAPRPDYAVRRRERAERMEAQRRFDDRRIEEEREARAPYPEPRRVERPLPPYPDRDRPVRERQWYSSDGRPMPAPDPRY